MWGLFIMIAGGRKEEEEESPHDSGIEGVAGDFSDGGDFEQSKEAEEKGT
jgi:hypothetical protein